MISLKKRFLSFLCVVMLIVSMVQPFAVLASEEALFLYDDVFAKDGNYIFDIGVETSLRFGNGYLAVAMYDDEENLLDVSMEEVAYRDSDRYMFIPQASKAKYYKIMLLDAENIVKPLCKALCGEIKPLENEIKILTDDLYSVFDNRIEYYESSTSNKRKTLKVNETDVSFDLNHKGSIMGYNVTELINLSEDIELKFIDDNSDAVYDRIIATQYSYEIVNDVDTERIKLGSRYINFDFSDSDFEYVFTDLNGNELSLSDFTAGDMVAVVSNRQNYADATYLKFINITDNKFDGEVTETASQGSRDFVWIDGVKYQDLYGLTLGDKGTFYIGMTGKIVEFVPALPEYAYLLEAYVESYSFAPDAWIFKMLTKDGVVQYKLSEDADMVFDEYYKYMLNIADGNTLWNFLDNCAELDNKYRFIVYETNDLGEIKNFDFVESNSYTSLKTIITDTYNSTSQKLDGNYIGDEATVFDVTSNNVNEACATDNSKLIDGEEYEGMVLYFNDICKILLITSGELYSENDDEIEETNLKYGYILQGAKAEQIFGSDVWELQFLTEDSTVTSCKLTEEASEQFEDNKVNLGMADGVEQWLWADNKNDCNNEYRFVLYETNAQGEIKQLEFVKNYHSNVEVEVLADAEYDFSAGRLDGDLISEDTMVFDVTSNNTQDAFVSNPDNYFNDNCRYEGLVIKINHNVKLVLITDSSFSISDNTGFAVITDVKYTIMDNEEYILVFYIQDMVEDSVLFDADSEIISGTENISPEELAVGDVIVFHAMPHETISEELVELYAVLGKINNSGLFDVYTDSLLAFSEDNEFVYGYIASEDGGASMNFDFVLIGGITDAYGYEIELAVGKESNTYCYFDSKRKAEIKTHYITADADFYRDESDDNKDEATFAFARIIDGVVSDIYTFNNRIIGMDNIIAEASNSVYVNCMTGDVIYGN